MKNNSRDQTLKLELLALIIFLLLWNLGTSVLPAFSLQEIGSNTPTGETAQTKDINPETLTLTSTYTATSEVEIPSVTYTPLIENTPLSNIRPLPAIFASGAHRPAELIVRFKSSTRETKINECLQSVDVQVKTGIEVLRAMVLEVKSGDVADIYNQILNCAGVLYVEPNFLLQAADTIPNDPNWGTQYGLVNIRAPQGWDLSTGSASVTIAIVDSGVDQGHPDLAGKLVAGYDFVNGDNDPQDDYGHGTHVAGIAAASSNNGAGVAGVSWGARIMPVKVLNATGGGTYANTALGVLWAADHGAQVINLSLGGTGSSSVLADAINYAHSKGVIVVAAAGNNGSNFVLYPARYPNVIAVARTNSTDNWDSSNYGPEIDLAAPGTMIYSTVIGGYEYKSGSSMATGYVSGLAAILMGISGNTSPDAIEILMESSALDIEFAGWDEYTGAGLIQMDAAIQVALPNVEFLEEQSPSVGGVIPGSSLPTSTLTSTGTASSTLSAQTTSATSTTVVQSAEIETRTPTNTPTDEASEVVIQSDSGRNNYYLPCAGILFILLGAFLAWSFTRKKR